MSGSCVTRTMVLPASCRRLNTAMISTPVLESRLPVGSSASRIDGSLTSARALPARELVRLVRGARRQFDLLERLPGLLETRLPRHAGVDERELDVVQR